MMRPVVASEIQIRRGTMEDLAQVREFTRHTFSWGDYLPERWERWVSSRHGDLLVAASGDLVVGTARVTFLGNDEAWLEGVRVRPSYRRSGVGSRLVQAAHDRAAAMKCRVIRLETWRHNLAAQRVFVRFGYRRITGYDGFAGAAHAGDLDRVRPAALADLDACWSRWQHSWLKRASREIVPSDYGWRWWELTRERLRHEIRAGRVWVADHAFMVLRDEVDDIDVILLIGARPGRIRLFDAARVIAARENKDAIYWLVPRTRIAARQAVEGGLTLDEEGLEIYACEL